MSVDLGPLMVENEEIEWQDAKWTPIGTIDCSVTHDQDNQVVRFNTTPDRCLRRWLFKCCQQRIAAKLQLPQQEIDDWNVEIRSQRDLL